MPINRLSPDEQAAYLRAILDSTVEGFYAVDTEGKTTVCNAAFLRMLGYKALEDVLDRKLHSEMHHSHPDGTPYDIADCPILTTAATGKGSYVSYEVFFRQDGTSFPVEYRVEPIFQKGVLKGAVCTFTDISEMVKTKAELGRLRQKAKDAIDRIEVAEDAGIVLATYVWDIPNDVVTGDDRFALLFGLSPEQAEAGVPLSFAVEKIHPDDISHVEALISQTLQDGGLYNTEYRVRQGNDWLWVQASGKVERSEDGQPWIFSGVISDIDHRKEIEKDYQDSQELLRLAQEAGGVGFFTVDIQSDKITASPEFFHIYGVEDLNIDSPSVFQALCIPEDKISVSNAQSRADGTAVLNSEYRIRRMNDNALRWISRRSNIIYDDHGRPSKMIGASIDITDEKEAGIVLQESQAQYQYLFNHIDEGFCVIEMVYDENDKPADYRFVEVNPAFEKHTGIANATGQLMRDIAPQHEQLWFDTYGDVAKTGQAKRFTSYASSLDGRDFDLYAFRIGKPDQKRVAVLFRDITEQNQSQKALRQAKQDAEAANIAKTEFLTNMSHEIRTPMNAIIGLSSILSMSTPLTDKQRQFISTLQISADGLLALINDLLDISKIEARTIELEEITFSLAELVREASDMMSLRIKEKGLKFSIDSDAVDQSMFIGDPTRIRQIILNLCSNAIKFTEQGEVCVTITAKRSHKPDTDMICISVQDTGIGIAPENIETIFGKFMQADASINRKYGGTGLGLAITRTLAEVMGGSAEAESVLGKGSCFKVYLPLRKTSEVVAMPTTPVASLPQEDAEKERVRLLLVEDYEPNVMVATILLENFGYSVEVASNGMMAVEMAKTRKFDTVLMDVQMYGLNGYEATALIRDHEQLNGLPRMPIIGMTAHALSGDRERCLAAGMDDYVPKPFNSEELNSKIRKRLA